MTPQTKESYLWRSLAFVGDVLRVESTRRRCVKMDADVTDDVLHVGLAMEHTGERHYVPLQQAAAETCFLKSLIVITKTGRRYRVR